MDLEANRFIVDRIPHRPPFLWLDKVIEISADSVLAEKRIPEDLDLFKGHYPDYPLMPGVLLCEAVFQAGALLVGEMLQNETNGGQVGSGSGMPVLTRILGAKFKREVHPGDTIAIHARLKERVGPAWFLKGTVRVQDKIAVQVEFACAVKG